MFPVGDFHHVADLYYAVLGLILGLVSGILASIILKLRIGMSTLVIDGSLGAATSLIVVAALWRLGTQYDFVMKVVWRYELVVAIVFSIALPAIHHYYFRNRVATKTK